MIVVSYSGKKPSSSFLREVDFIVEVLPGNPRYLIHKNRFNGYTGYHKRLDIAEWIRLAHLNSATWHFGVY